MRIRNREEFLAKLSNLYEEQEQKKEKRKGRFLR